jgi:hypothetical protein
MSDIELYLPCYQRLFEVYKKASKSFNALLTFKLELENIQGYYLRLALLLG